MRKSPSHCRRDGAVRTGVAPAPPGPVPAVLEYLPYRKSDSTAIDDSVRHPYFAERGYAGVRVDIRGSGDSEGVLMDEYQPQEQEDALELLRWIAAQEWCDGSIGMMGISWGGFNSLQMAARRPPAAEGDHHRLLDRRSLRRRRPLHGRIGAGVLHAALGIGDARLQRPAAGSAGGRRTLARDVDGAAGGQPVPGRDLARATSAATPTGSRARCARTTAAIECPVYLVGGWSDGYTNAIFRMLEGLSCPRRARDRPVGARVARGGRARPRDRLPAGGDALVGSLAEGNRHRDHGRAAGARLCAGFRAAPDRL